MKEIEKICSIEDCEKNVFAKGLCSLHYQRVRTHNNTDYIRNRFKPTRYCDVDGCNEIHHSKGFCTKHHMRFITHGDPLIVKVDRHGQKKIPEYSVWGGIKSRCFNKNSSHYHRYGGRGITVCERWKNSFDLFYEDMGSRPSPNHQIDRTDNNGNYSPDNCKWVTPKENMNNRSCSPKNRK